MVILPSLFRSVKLLFIFGHEDIRGLPWWLSGKESTHQAGNPGSVTVGKIPWRRKWQPTPVLLPGESHGQGAWQATVHWIANSRTQLSDRLSLFIKTYNIFSSLNVTYILGLFSLSY